MLLHACQLTSFQIHRIFAFLVSDARHLAYLVSLQRFCFCFCFQSLLCFLRMEIEIAQLEISGHFPGEACRSPQRQCNMFCVSCQLPCTPAVYLLTWASENVLFFLCFSVLH